MDIHRKRPSSLGVRLGKVNYGSRGKRDEWEVYNRNGELYVVKYSPIGRRWLVSKQHIARGYMLRKLGIESNAGGGMFVPWQWAEKTGRKTFRGMTRKQIIKAQHTE